MNDKLIPCLLLLFVFGCGSEIKKENRVLVKVINKKIDAIDANHRVRIVEDDFHNGDSVFKIRGYYMDDYLVKMVSILNTPHYERDDYFYFDNHKTIFAGHLMNYRDELLAAEYKFYYRDGKIVETLFWEDHYKRGQRFPHEDFSEFEPDMDSLTESEKQRFEFFFNKLETEGFEVLHLNENLEAN
ncbi:MAG: hypothetical protein KI790_15150 [Cyclobacteriaceae bacterium]|nr:hypothetical protein [Cyclobacteriaceae bacterium HetDA_MAG_MS6]